MHPAVAISPPDRPHSMPARSRYVLDIGFAPIYCQVGNRSSRYGLVTIASNHHPDPSLADLDRPSKKRNVDAGKTPDMTVGKCGARRSEAARDEARGGHILPMRISLLNYEKFAALREFRPASRRVAALNRRFVRRRRQEAVGRGAVSCGRARQAPADVGNLASLICPVIPCSSIPQSGNFNGLVLIFFHSARVRAKVAK